MRRLPSFLLGLLIGLVVCTAMAHNPALARSKSKTHHSATKKTDPAQANPKNAQAYTDRGLSFYQKSDYDHAIADLNAAIAIDPNFSRAYQVRADTFYYKRDYDHAIADYSKLIEVDAKDKQAYKDRGLSYYQKSDYDHAIADLNAAIAIDPNFSRAYQIRGDAFYYKRDYGHAIADYSKLIEVDAKDKQAYKDRGLSYYQKSDYDHAIADLNAAIAIDPNFSRAYQIRGDAYYYKGDYDRAIADYSELVRINPKNAGALKDRGLAYYRKADYPKAIADLNQAIAIDPNFSRAYQVRGDAYRAQSDNDRAIADYSEAIRLDPKISKYLNERGLLYEQRGSLDRALADFNAAMSVDPKQSNAEERIRRVEQKLAALAGLTPASVAAQSGAKSAAKENRIALVIGNANYANVSRLTNPKSDAEKIAATLRSIGFSQVTLVLDLSRDKLTEALKAFRAQADRADWAVVYYAGHGIEFGGVNYLIPTDARLASDRDIALEAIALDDILLTVEGAKKLRLVILDACRDNPFVKTMSRSISTRSVGQGLAQIEPEGATLVAYSAKHGQVALDGEAGNSPFVTALAEELKRPGLEINVLFRRVRDDVLKMTARSQEPFTYGSLPAEEFYFH